MQVNIQLCLLGQVSQMRPNFLELSRNLFSGLLLNTTFNTIYQLLNPHYLS
jgi:hypothetical protein